MNLVNPYVFGGVPDPYWANVVSLLPFDGGNGSTTIIDIIGKTWTITGAAALSTAEFVSGPSSFRMPGATDYLVGPASADFNFNGVDATMEGFVRADLFTSDPQGGVRRFITLATALGVATYGEIVFAVISSTGNRFLFAMSTSAGTSIFNRVSVNTYSTNTWYHWAITKQNAGGGNWTWRLFLGGVLDDSVTVATDVSNVNHTGVMSRLPQTANVGNFQGYGDEVRITKGVCRYTANFTPPTGSFPRF